jgi:hypothetical protein
MDPPITGIIKNSRVHLNPSSLDEFQLRQLRESLKTLQTEIFKAEKELS